MRLPEITLDDRSFQDLVNEARLRVGQACPEWTEHNVSDPGITLVELFAWMTDILLYRLNRVPDKLHVALLDLVGVQLQPPSAASAELRFRLSAPAEEPVRIPARETEVGTVRTASEESIVFQTLADFVIPPARPIAYAVERSGTVKDVGVANGTAEPKGPDQLPFATPPIPGDALYLGFDTPLARLLLQLDVDCSQARGVGVDPEDPPLQWEVSTHDGWAAAEVIVDRTGGFNYGSGAIELELPAEHAQASVGDRRAYWLRCRLTELTRSGREGASFSHPPEIYSITAAPIGALLPATHADEEVAEDLGESDGTPGQAFPLRHAPVLAPEPGETLEVLEPGSTEWERWELRESFVESGPGDRHFVLDAANGEVQLGPSVRIADGRWRAYGAVPPKASRLRFSEYRHGGGRRGNVAAGTLTVLKDAVPGVASVTNPAAAFGGVDAETLDSARQRASMEIRTRHRAVTAEDFEFLAVRASPRVARAKCTAPEPGEPVRVHVLPRVEPADRRLELAELVPDEGLLRDVADYLDERRLIGTHVRLLPVSLKGVSVVVNLQAAARSDLVRIEQEVAYALYTYLNPIVGGSPEGIGSGWEFGRALNEGELYAIAHAVDGVEFVKILRIYETDLASGKRADKQAGSHVFLAPDEVIASGEHIVKAEHREGH